MPFHVQFWFSVMKTFQGAIKAKYYAPNYSCRIPETLKLKREPRFQKNAVKGLAKCLINCGIARMVVNRLLNT